MDSVSPPPPQGLRDAGQTSGAHTRSSSWQTVTNSTAANSLEAEYNPQGPMALRRQASQDNRQQAKYNQQQQQRLQQKQRDSNTTEDTAKRQPHPQHQATSSVIKLAKAAGSNNLHSSTPNNNDGSRFMVGSLSSDSDDLSESEESIKFNSHTDRTDAPTSAAAAAADNNKAADDAAPRAQLRKYRNGLTNLHMCQRISQNLADLYQNDSHHEPHGAVNDHTTIAVKAADGHVKQEAAQDLLDASSESDNQAQ
ncbi:hypothetical protein EV182_007119, partial [Spiromyces aspiralis]